MEIDIRQLLIDEYTKKIDKDRTKSEELDRIRVKAEDTEKRALAFIDMVEKRIRGTKRKYVNELDKLRRYDEWRTQTQFCLVDHLIRKVTADKKDMPKMPDFEAEEENEKEKDQTKTKNVSG